MAAPLRSRACLSRSYTKCLLVSEKANKLTPRLLSPKYLHSGVIRSLPRSQLCPKLRLLSRHSCCKNWCAVLPLIPVRNASSQSDLPTGYIPDVPSVPVEDIANILPELNALGEPTLTSLGLGSNWPPGLFQKALEFIHVGLDLPWWGSICVVVFCIRVAVFPLMVKQRRHVVNMGNHMPTIARLQQRISDAKATGNYLDLARKQEELQDYIERNNIKMLMFLLPVLQFPIFISVFLGLRKMSELPVESLTTGGMGWFTDLTLPDPYYLLPLITAGSLLAVVELGAESNKAAHMAHVQKWLMRGMPVVVFIFTCNFPAAMCVYWAVNNSVSLVQSQIFKLSWVKRKLKIPDEVKHPDGLQGRKKQKFLQGFKDSMDNSKMTKQASERKYIEELDFKKAGTGPVPKTYAYDPTKQKKKQESM